MEIVQLLSFLPVPKTDAVLVGDSYAWCKGMEFDHRRNAGVPVQKDLIVQSGDALLDDLLSLLPDSSVPQEPPLTLLADLTL